MSLFLTSISLFVLFTVNDSIDVPVIGVIPQPCSDCIKYNLDAKSYVPASYIQWLQMSGAAVIPLFYSIDAEELSHVLSQINGVLIVGGSAPTSPITEYEKFIQMVMGKSREFHDYHRSFGREQSLPIWGTCDGFENMLTAVCESGEECMGRFDADGINLPIQFNEEEIAESVMFGESMYDGYKELVMELLSTQNVTYNSHSKGITPRRFYSDPFVSSNFTNLATSFDETGKEFVTLIESKKELGLHWFASQFHPEKSEFELNATSVVHSYPAVVANTWFSQFFVEQCRQNRNSMNDAEFHSRIIYNYQPIWTDDYFEQIYIFTQ